MKMRPAPLALLQAAVAILVGFCPDLTVEILPKALRAFDPSRAKTPDQPQKPWTLRQTAEFLGVCVPTVRKAIKLWRIKALRLPGSRMVRVDPESVVGLVDARREAASEGAE